MKLTLVGHTHRYAVEQSALNYFPGQDGELRSTLFVGGTYLTGRAEVTLGGRTVAATARLRGSGVREQQSVLKHAVYRAAVELTGSRPAWGALTGIRPAKLAGQLLRDLGSRAAAERVLDRRYGVSPERRALALDCAEAGLRLERTLAPEDIALYVGIPFCPTRCAYCSFVSLDVHRAGKLTEPFCAALAQEMRAAGEVVRRSGKRVVSVYWGGGTPTALSAEQLDRLLGTLAERFDLRDVREHTVEAGRPDTITAEKLGVLRAHGVTRVSVNPQTMDDGILEGIGRRHTAAQTLEAVELVRAAGCFTLNMDLIAGLPGDDPQTFLRGLAGVLDCRPGNVTVHTLARKNGARITTGAEALPEPAAVGEMLDGASARLRAAGYGPYYLYRQKYMAASRENVGWSLPGAECLYNLIIMEELRTVLALGAGGSTKLVYPAENRIERVFNPKYAKEYIDAIDTVARRKEGIF